MAKTLSFRIEPDFKGVDRVRLALQKLCNEIYRGPEAESRTGELCLAATEAMNNAVEHSGADQVEIEICADEAAVLFRITTGGGKFDPTVDVSMPALDEDDELPEGGFGLAIIKAMVDNVRYEHVEGKNIMTLDKRIIG